MKTLTIVLFLSISCLFCFNKFEIVEATSKKWTGGIPQAGYGTNYDITIVPNVNSDKLVFDRIWIGKKYFGVSTFQKGKKIRNNLFGKGDTISILINDRIVRRPLPYEEKCLVEKHELPYKYEGEALLSYTYKGKRKFKIIEKFTKLKEDLYP